MGNLAVASLQHLPVFAEGKNKLALESKVLTGYNHNILNGHD
jgi:hypothetical protein